jgi:predicted transcriptional regulator
MTPAERAYRSGKGGTAEELIMQCLTFDRKEWTTTQLMKKTGVNQATLWYNLRQLVTRGKVIKSHSQVHRGGYRYQVPIEKRIPKTHATKYTETVFLKEISQL